jgi:hypothetical protein
VTVYDLTARVSAEARRYEFARTVRTALRAVLTAIAAVLYAAGWVAFKTLAGLWLVAVWVGAAVKVGWREARAAERT